MHLSMSRLILFMERLFLRLNSCFDKISFICGKKEIHSSRIAELAIEIKNLSPVNAEYLLECLRDGLSEKADEYECYQIAEIISAAVYPKYKFSEYSRIFLEDDEFISYYRRFMDANNWHSLDRKYTLNQLLKMTMHLDGDVAECGTYNGASAYLMCQAHRDSGRIIHLFDSFEGLSAPECHDGDYWERGALAMPESVLKESLQGFENYRAYKGWIPDRFSDVENLNFSFIHIDVDLYQPTLASLEFFYDRLDTGGVILMDDYGFKSCPGARLAADDFFSNKPEQVMMLPTGQAFVVKR